MLTKLIKNPLKLSRRIYLGMNPESSTFGRNWKMLPGKEYANRMIYNSLIEDKPVMISRLGANEISCMVNYLGVSFPGKYRSVVNFIKGKAPAWWWEKWVAHQMHDVAGFFPNDTESLARFSRLMITELQQVDILGSWMKEEGFFRDELSHAKNLMLEDLEPFFCQDPWTRALAGQRVLVVHPFAKTIRSQYARKDLVFPDELLPDFDLLTLTAVQTSGNGDRDARFKSWFEALDWMKEEITRANFDICILGCGAYGFPLAAHVKRMGKKAVHLGGVTQLLFGIRGKRWEDYVVYPYANLFNEHWVRPQEDERPPDTGIVEGGCYW